MSISLKGTNTNPKKIDIYGIEKIYETTLKRLKTKTDITEEDRKSILEFVDHLLAKNMTKLRVVKYICQMTVVAQIAGKPLASIDKKGMEKIIGQINTANYADNTKHDYKVSIRKYFQWLRG
jgi:integrase/recombinase XerD